MFNGGNVGIGTISPSDRLDVAREGSVDLGAHFGWNKMVLSNLHNMNSPNGGNHSIGSKILYKGYKDAALSTPQNIYSLGTDVFGDVTSTVEKNNFFIRDEYTLGTPVRFFINSTGNVGIGTTSPGASSLLELSSTTQGFVLPRMTKAERDAIASPAEGMAIYQTDNTPGLRVYNGTSWMKFTETAD